MSVTLKSGDSTDIMSVDPTSYAGRVTLYNTSGNVVGGSSVPLVVLSASGRTKLGTFACSTFRTLGTATTPQNIATIENPAASTVNIAIKRFTIQTDSSAALATVSPSIKVSIPSALPTGGTVIPAVKFNSTYPSAVAVIRGGTASDGGVATAITATAGNSAWTQLVDRQQTAAGFVTHTDNSLLPQLIDTEPFILLPGESLLVQGVLANAATTHFLVNVCWEEYS